MVKEGKTVGGVVARVREVVGKGVRIMVVAGVVQAKVVEKGVVLGILVERDELVKVVTLRLSENKFTGRG